MERKKLWLWAVLLELGNFVASYVIGRNQMSHCPRNTILPLFSVAITLTTIVLLVLILVRAAKAGKWVEMAAAILAVPLVSIAGVALGFSAYGGLNWCGYNF